MEEINLKDLFNYFISKLYIVIIIITLAVFLGFIYGEFIKVPKYQSYTTIVLTTTSESNDNGITQNDISLNQKLVSTYREIIKSRRVLNQVIKNLDLDMKADALGELISVTNTDETELIKITVTCEDKKMAKEIANEIAKVFSEEIVDIYNIQNVSIIDSAITSNNPYNMNIIKDMVIAGALGLVLSLGIIFLIFYFDTTIKNVEEVQTKLGLPLLGAVPKLDKNKKKKNKKDKKGA